LRHKDNLSALGTNPSEIVIKQGLSYGAVHVVHKVARSLGIVAALGTTCDGLLALWQVIARVIDQGSRLSAVRLARAHAAKEILGMGDFDEDDLYVRRGKARSPSGRQTHPATFAPAGSNRSGRGGNE
jgi:hypothetical protein